MRVLYTLCYNNKMESMNQDSGLSEDIDKERWMAVQLLRLELKGFKSFADKTIVDFSQGMTAIVGPNGSGKSNITDAIRWVLGESNVRNLRGQKAEDIIFSGTEKRKPMGAAEVSLVFDNSDHTLGDEWSEVVLSRKIYRNGDSEFFINRRHCRLKDIHMLLADTGLGKDSMAIIGQNRVDAILNSKPEERRLIFEDVAGIGRFKLNKEDAVRRIQGTERNLERVQDLLAALQEQLEPLVERAEKTKRHNELQRVKRQYDGALAHHDYKTADRLLTRLENEHIGLQTEAEALQESLQTQSEERRNRQLEAQALQEELQQKESAYTESQRELERLHGRSEVLRTELKAKEKEQADLQYRLEEIQASLQGEQQQILLLERLLETGRTTLTVKESEKSERQAQYEQAKAAVIAKQAQWQAVESQKEAMLAQHLAISSALEKSRAEAKVLATQQAENHQLLATLAAEMKVVDQEVEDACTRWEKLKQAQQGRQETVAASLAALNELKFKRRDAQKQEEKLHRQEQQLEGRLQLLAQWEEQHEGYLPSTKMVLQAKTPWRKGIYGAVGELFTVKDTYAVAVEVALGASVHHVVTDTAETATKAISYLKEHQGGRATFLPCEAVRGQRLQSPALQEDAVLGILTDFVTFDPLYEGIFTYLLGRTLVVETAAQAVTLQRKYKHQLRLVTLTGEQFQPGGSLTGGSLKQKRASLWAQKKERQQLVQEKEYVQTRLQDLQQELAKSEAELERLTQVLQSGEEAVREHTLYVATAESQYKAVQEKQGRKQRLWHEKESLAKNLQAQLEAAQHIIGQREKELQILTGEQREGNGQGELLAEVQALQEIQQQAYEELAKSEVAYTSLAQQLAEQAQELERRRQAMAMYEARLQPLTEELVATRKACQETLPHTLAEVGEALQRLQIEAQDLAATKETLYEKSKVLQTQLNSLQESMQAEQNRREQVQKRLVDMEGRLTKNRLDTESALAKLAELGFSQHEAGNLHLSGGVEVWRTEQANLLAKIAELGPINPNAVAEYEEALEREAFMRGQQEDLVEAKAHLEAVIAEMDKAMAVQLSEVIAVVEERFQIIFEQLFGGGRAQIVVTDTDNILTGGIDLYIQPPGKKRQQLTLLSGGERALTVIALLFAFLDYRPAPFCVLDEVDAALDEANVERFSKYLQNLGEATQFIVVSHRKKTMEAATVLQGVTMVERGVSRLLTVAFEEAAAVGT